MRLNYQSIGSGGGIRQIEAKTVDFGASDAPLKPAELNKYGLMQFPMIMGGGEFRGESSGDSIYNFGAKMIKGLTITKYFLYILQTMSGKGAGDRIRTEKM